MAFSQNKHEWVDDVTQCDAITWYMASDRHDFTFRLQLFGKFPKVIRHTQGFNIERGRWYDV